VSPFLKADKEIVLAALKSDVKAYHHVADHLKYDPEILELYKGEISFEKQILIARMKNKGGHNLKLCEDYWRDDRDVVLAAVSNYGSVLEIVNPFLKADKEIVLAALKSDVKAYHHIADHLKDDPEILELAKGGISLVTEKQKNIENQTWSKEKRRLVDKFRVGDGHEIRNCEDCWRCDRDVVLAAMASCGKAIQFIAEPLRADKEIVLLALKTNRRAISYASAKLQKDPDIIAASKRVDDSVFEVTPEEYAFLMQDIIIDNSQEDKEEIEFQRISADWSDEKRALVQRLKVKGYGLRYVEEHWYSDRDVIMAAVSNRGEMLELADPALKEDKEIVTAALRNDWQAFQYVADHLKYDTAFITQATRTDLDYEDNEDEVDTSKGLGGWAEYISSAIGSPDDTENK